MTMLYKHETQLALRAALEGGRIALHSSIPKDIQLKTSFRDVVTNIDLEIEQKVVKILSESEYPILGEETTQANWDQLDSRQRHWVVDPIDGTTNFVHGLEYFGTSVGLYDGTNFLVGTVCLPHLGQLYSTLGTEKAMLNGRVLIHQHQSIENALVAGSFSSGYSNQLQRTQEYSLFGQINDLSRGALRLGSAASNICFVAAGKLQAAYGLNAKIWDVAGSLAIALASGCDVRIIPSTAPFELHYIVGSKEVVAEIQKLAIDLELMGES
jgi:myo-inositol-1(or 4)-monophosphatase